MSFNQQTKSDFVIDNGFLFLGLGVLIVGVFLGLDYGWNDEVQTAVIELKQTEYAYMITVGDNTMTYGYYVVIIAGIILSILGYSLKRLLKWINTNNYKQQIIFHHSYSIINSYFG